MAAGSMTVAEREAFLAEVHVGVLAVERPGRGPLALPIWYRFADGVVEIGMDGSSLKAQLLRAAGRATMSFKHCWLSSGSRWTAWRMGSPRGSEQVGRVSTRTETNTPNEGALLAGWNAALPT